MSTATTHVTPTFLSKAYIEASIMKFSVARYDWMVNDGILTPEDRVELLENYVVLKLPHDPAHNGTVLRISKRLARRLPPGWDIRCQSAVVFSDSQPEPDLAVVPEDKDDYTTRHPSATAVRLLIEVANTSLLRDQQDKARIYARGNVACYWIVNLDDRRVEVHTQPSGPCDAPAYASVVNYAATDSEPLVLDGVAVATVPVADLLP
jgi:Uma2 family endonuclease